MFRGLSVFQIFEAFQHQRSTIDCSISSPVSACTHATFESDEYSSRAGSALSYAAALMGLRCVIFWVRAVYNWKTDRRTLMKLMGADIYASPSKETTIGKTVLTKNANHQGSLGIAVEEDLNLTTQQ